jgi:hypothetical protein
VEDAFNMISPGAVVSLVVTPRQNCCTVTVPSTVPSTVPTLTVTVALPMPG